MPETPKRAIDKTDRSAPVALPGQIVVLLEVPEGVPPEWFEGVRRIMTRPASAGIWPERWAEIRNDCWALLRDHGAKACRLGWTTLDLFGCHHTAPLARLDCMGLALLLHGRGVIGLDVEAARIAASSRPLIYRRRFRPHPEAMLLWDLCP